MAKTDKRIGSVYQTDNLDQFRYLDSNRELKSRVSRVKKSIKEYGWINNPIVCNEKMEVIDGQARLQACKDLGIGLTYTVIPSLGIKECRVLNSISANWTVEDYVKSYADSGKVDYKYVYQILVKIKTEWGKSQTHILRQMCGDSAVEKSIKTGLIKFTEKEYNEATQCVSWVTPFRKVLVETGFDTAKMYEALYYASRKLPEEHKIRLLRKFEKRLNKLEYKQPSSVADGIAIIDDISNYGIKKAEKFYLFHIYEKEGLYSG